METMIERAARALATAPNISVGRPFNGHDACACMGAAPDEPACRCVMSAAREAARLVIEAMREPPEAMRLFETSGGELWDWDVHCGYCGGHKFAWQGMIDAALNPASSPSDTNQQPSP